MDAFDVAVFAAEIDAALWWYGVPLLVLAAVFGYFLARVTRPSMDGLSVRERW